MKKSVIAIVFIINLGLVLSACSKKADPIMLPSLNEISSIEIVNEGKSIIYSDKEWVESFIQKVNEAKPTSKKSIHDGPTVSEYTQVNLVANVNTLKIFIYKENARFYIEQPYQGIYETDETFLDFIKSAPK